MLGDKLTSVLLVFYAVILVAYLYERDWRHGLYWVGAILIVLSVRLLR